MKKLLSLIIIIIIIAFNLTLLAQNTCPSFDWAESAGGTDTDGGHSLVLDSQGNSYITGRFAGTATFGGTTHTSSGGQDIFVSKLDASGNYIWTTSAGGNSTDISKDIAIDSHGNSYITGSFQGTATFGTTTLTSWGGQDVFVAKLDASGNFIWAIRAGRNNPEQGRSIDLDAQGNIYITGRYTVTTHFGSFPLNGGPGYNVFIAKLDTSGDFLWLNGTMGSHDNYSNSISVDSLGNSYITGDFIGTAQFGTTELNSFGGADVFIAKLNASGNFLWATGAGGNASDFGNDITIDSQGNSYITGGFIDNASFDNIILSGGGSNDIFIAKLDASGNFIWAKGEGGNNSDQGISIAVDSLGNSYITGVFSGSVGFGTTVLTSLGYSDVYIAKLNPMGHFIWAKSAGGNSSQQVQVHSIAIDSQGNSHITGSLFGTASFGDITHTSFGNSDTFVAKVIENELSISSMGTLEILCGESTSLPGVAANYSSLSWSPSSDLDNPSVLNPMASPNQTTSYTLTATDECQNLVNESITVNVSPYTVDVSTSNTTIYCGTSTQINASVIENIQNVSYSWSPSQSLNNPNIANPEASPVNTTTYTVTATTPNGCSVDESIIINVTPYTVEVSASNTTIDCGTSTQLNATVLEDVENVSYSWSPSQSLNNSNIANPEASPGLTTTYTITATGQNGCTGTEEITINVDNPNPTPINITSNTGDFELCDNGLTLSVSGFESYMWSNGSTSSFITINAPGTYSVTAYEANGCASVDSITVESISGIETPQGTVLCPSLSNQTVKLVATAGMDSYYWSTGEQTQTIQVSEPGNYSVTTSKGDCNYTSNVTVTVSTGQATADFSYVANGLSVEFTPISSSINFLAWEFGDGNSSSLNNPTHTYSQPGTYDVKVIITDLCGNTAERTKSITVSVLDIAENENTSSIKTYPNPTRGKIYIESKVQLESIKIIDLKGKLLYQNENPIATEIDLQELSKGIYLMEIESGSGRIVKKIVKE